ncbi:ATP-dependent DNA helicase RecG [uncultured Polaribacter sp.]|uniref:ATP-dependent DNA helicase RecG n=1 Tax=uncultured Polaribacter sp. TaxID=174711 RepID=UPI00262CDC59|nr:ATP-dependent DNA helicase RecG [uncultured Polaribacter sp.]
MLTLNNPITYIKGVSVQKASLLYAELGIKTCNDLLNFFPFRYIDKTTFYTINQLQPTTAEVQIVGKITSVKSVAQKRGSRLVATFQDQTGSIELVWFKGQKWIKDALRINEPYVVYGKLNHYNGSFSIPHPELELVAVYKKKLQSKMQPVYPSTEKLTNSGVSNKLMRTYVQNLLQQFFDHITESLSQEIIDNFNLMSKREALLNAHFPKSQESLAKAQSRLKFEELFFIQLQLLRKKLINKSKIKGFVFENVSNNFNTFYNDYLPFNLTNAQKRVLKEIRKDVASGAHMNRLLQGDVGSGKTIVALLAMLLALDNGFQATMMAPTEILATQHYIAISEMLANMNIKVALLTGSVRVKKRREIHNDLMDGSLHILIGTHALLEDKVTFKNLGIAIIDEQHRFGVAQRSKLWKKNTIVPHILVMTATPIPRTLAMSVYGDLDVSVIDELPPGRKEVKTVHRFDSNRLSVFKFMKDEIEKGRQVYIVYPLIQESEAMDYKDLMDGYESVSREFPSPKYQISIVHGQMKPADKEFEMQRFVNGETQIMVATTVIEVGVNVPNASVMIIESAERFGLSQLHQLRGRVGRGADQSYCILLSSYKLSEEGKTRLKTMVDTTDGFKIAEVDLKLRGPGNIMGTQQSGVLNLKIADIVKDSKILVAARNTAISLLQDDDNLSKPENSNIKKTFIQLVKTSKIWSEIS